MSEEYLNRTPISDIDTDDLSLVETYKGKINENNFTDAVKILDAVSFEKGIRADVVDKIRTSILSLEAVILNLTADDDTYYSVDMPTDEQMNGKKFWVRPI
mgnify:FL=1